MFAAVGEFFTQCAVEEDDGFSAGHPEFGAAEREDIDAGFPRQLCGFYAEGCDGVCETGAVHVEPEAESFTEVAELSNFGWGIDRAEFGWTAEGKGLGLREMDVAPFRGDFLDRVGIEFAEGARHGEEFGAVGEELWRAAFIGFDV